MKNNYFPNIDILRFIAALSVMLFHYFSYTLRNNHDFLSIYIKHGYLGVELFFIISGFVIFFSLNKNIKDYAVARFLRLYPIFWILCTITYVLTLIYTPETALNVKYYLLNMLMINDNKTAFLIDGVYWTLTQELIFYIFIGVFVYLFNIKRIKYFYLTWIIISFATFYFGFENNIISKILLTRYAGYFSFGGLCAMLYNKKDYIKNIWDRYLIYIGLFTSFLLPIYTSEKLKTSAASITNKFGVFYIEQYIILLVLLILFILSIYSNKYFTNNKFIKISIILGTITYPLYLIHYKIGFIIMDEINKTGQTINILIFTSILMIFLAYMISIYELKIRKWIKVKIYNII